MRSALWKAAATFGVLAAMSLAPVGAAEKQIVNDTVPVDVTVANPCTNEDVHLTGSLHAVMTLKKSDKGTKAITHFNAQGIQGEGVTSGKRYTASGTDKGQADASTLPTDFVASGRFRLNGQGAEPNLRGTVRLKVHVNADGTYSIVTDTIVLECR